MLNTIKSLWTRVQRRKILSYGYVAKYLVRDENWTEIGNVERVKQCAWDGNGPLMYSLAFSSPVWRLVIVLTVSYMVDSSVQLLSRVRLFVTPWISARQASLPITNSRSLPKLMSIDLVMPYHSLLSPSPAPNPSQHQGLFQRVNSWLWGGQSTGVSALASFLLKNTQDWSPLEWTGWISLQSKRLSQETSPTPQFKSISSSMFSFLHNPTLTSIYDHWENLDGSLLAK